MIGRTNAGGGSAFAVIDVSYPEGAACTCSNGTRTLKAKDTSGHWLFAIPKAGEWTVNATNGTKEKSVTVTVTEEKAYTAKLTFELVLFDNGEYAEETGGWNKTGKKLSLSASTTSMDGDEDNAYTNNPIDLTGYNTLRFILDSTSSSRDQGRLVGVGSSKTGTGFNAKLNITNSSGTGEKSIDVSQLNGEYYVKAYCQAWPEENGAWATTTLTISKVWLE